MRGAASSSWPCSRSRAATTRAFSTMPGAGTVDVARAIYLADTSAFTMQYEIRQAQIETAAPGEVEDEALVSLEVQSGDDDVGIEYDPHARARSASARCSSTRSATSSLLMPSSAARDSP